MFWDPLGSFLFIWVYESESGGGGTLETESQLCSQFPVNHADDSPTSRDILTFREESERREPAPGGAQRPLRSPRVLVPTSESFQPGGMWRRKAAKVPGSLCQWEDRRGPRLAEV